MPVVVVTAPMLPDQAVSAALKALNGAVASSLGLPVDKVHSMVVVAVAGCTGETTVAAWPTAVLHGRRREPSAIAAAVDAAAAVLAEHWSQPVREVWSQWVTSS